MKTVVKVREKVLEEGIKLIKKGTLEIVNENELKEKFIKSKASGKPLVIKLGLDPTAPDLHLGHTVVLRKIRQFQSLGHKAFIVIGDFTGRIGDPTGKSKERPQLSEREVLENADTYRQQLNKILDPEKTIICFNSEWLDTLKLSDLIELMSKQTVARILERDSFKKRMRAEQPIGLHELIYPLLQGFDSLTIEADIEIGGNDQRFNILMGRDMQSKEGVEKQVAIFMPIIEGIDGVLKMSKSLDNYIGINEPAEVMFEKIMRIKDEQIIKYFNLLTDLSPNIIEKFRQQIESGQTNPKNIKIRLAREITSLYNTKEATIKAEERFIQVFAKKGLPKEMPSYKWENEDDLMTFLVRNEMVASKSEVRRLVKQKGIRINDSIILEPEVMALQDGDVIRIGKKRFVKVN